MNWYPWFSFLLVVMMGALCIALPRFSRPDIYFGITVDPAFRYSEAGRSIGRRYALHATAWTAAAIVIVVASALLHAPAFSGAAFGVVTIGSIAALVVANRHTRPHAASPSPVREAPLVVREDRLPGGWIASLLPYLILAASGVYLNLHWDEIPERFPIHWGIDGQPNGWAERTPRGVYGMLGMGALFCLMMTIVNWFIVRSRRISYQGTAARFEGSFRAANVWTILVTQYLMAVLFAVIPLLTIFHPGSAEFAGLVNTAITIVLMVILFAVFFRLGQGGTRLAGPAAVHTPPIGDRTPDDRWKWGIIYYNPEDPAIMVEKRFGFGYTMNFGNVWSWVLLIVLFALPLGGVFLFRS
jgi:uncharacterized membrane protein